MFTGLIEGTGKLVQIERRGKDMSLSILASFDLDQLEIGESVSVDGVCLTVVSWEGRTFTVDVSQETLSRTKLARCRPGDEVNLERALKFGDRLGGHLVNGHVDGRAKVVGIERKGESWVFVFEIGAELSRYLIEKGSVAVNGVSLTINRTDVRSLEVNVIPHTFQVTTMGKLRVGDEVNIEVDIIGKYVEKFVGKFRQSGSSSKNSMDSDFLEKHGFL